MAAGFKSVDTYSDLPAILVGDSVPTSRKITLLSGENRKRGTVLGKITASGKYKIALSASADGSQVPAVILAEDTDASAGDKDTVAYFAAVVDENALTYGAGITAANAREPLRDYGILLQSSIG